MSIVGLRSYEYRRAADLDKKLKKLVEKVRSEPRAASLGARQARTRLALELVLLSQLLDPLAEDTTIHAREALRLPVPMIRQLREAQLGDQPIRDALKETVARLRSDKIDLADSDFELFDLVLSAASHEASDAFDRVVRR